ncbi:MAG: 3-phosphoshikimate 1-carboxyvinyltransferase, partial [Pseudomonadota bacterium]
VSGKKLQGIDYTMKVASAQVKSSLLLAGLYAEGTTRIREPMLSRDHTERMLGFLGLRLEAGNNEVSLAGGAEIHGGRLTIPGDISSAAFFIAAGLLVKNSEILLRNVGINPTRKGILEILQRMGGSIDIVNERQECGEPVADIAVRSSRLKAVEIGGEIIPRTIDEIPVLAVAASLAEGTTIIRDAKELRVKESDRIAAMARELRKCGVAVEERDDGMAIAGRESLRGAVCESYGDHRVAMSMAVAGLCAEEEMIIEGCGCIKTSFPEFMDNLQQLRL